MPDTATVIAGGSAFAAFLAAAYAGAQASNSRRSADAAEKQVAAAEKQVATAEKQVEAAEKQATDARRAADAAEKQGEAAQVQADAAERAARAAEESADLAREQLHDARAQGARDRERDEEARRPKLEPLPSRPAGSPAPFNLRVTQPMEFSGWFVNRGPGTALIDRVCLDTNDGSILDGAPRTKAEAQPVEELPVSDGEECNVYVPALELSPLYNNPKRELVLEVRYGVVGDSSLKWWVSVRLQPKPGDVGRHEWVSSKVTVRRDE